VTILGSGREEGEALRKEKTNFPLMRSKELVLPRLMHITPGYFVVYNSHK